MCPLREEMDVHPNAQVVMRGFEAFAKKDMATMKGLFADDAVWHTPGNNQFSGDYQGPDAIVRMMGEISSAATIENTPHDVLASDGHVVVLVASKATKPDKTLESNNVFVFHVDGDKVTEAWGIPSNQAAADAFWG